MAPKTFPFDMDSLAKALAPLVSKYISDSITAALAKQHDELIAKLDQLIAVNSSLSSAISSTHKQPAHPIISNSTLYSTVARVVHTDAAVLQEKAKRAVFIGVPHASTKEATAKEDSSMVAEVIRQSDNRELLDALEAGNISTQRHPSYEVTPGRTRPLKVSFPSKTLRDQFINYVRFNKPQRIKNHPHCYVRRDYTDHELCEDRRLRQQAGIMNAQAKQLKYVVRDLRIITLKSPRELPKRVLNPLSSSDIECNSSAVNPCLYPINSSSIMHISDKAERFQDVSL
ncbi:hypothetical protein AB6A40_005802 [Gnathostoma spinigerum]|uniref:Uncharacterized protein n=1 Tax=Gnathostoma spinigerum TaxID=75299 RepID=A0ABD6EQ16_9BILA